MEPQRSRLPRVSLHSLPPLFSNCPLPAIGYLKGYLERHRPGISVTAAYWHQVIRKLVRPWVDDRLWQGELDSHQEFFDAVFARLYLLETEESAHEADLEFLQKYGSIFLDSQPLEGMAALCDAIASFLDAEAKRLCLDTMDIIGASVMHRELIPALAFLRYAKRRFRPALAEARGLTRQGPLTILGGFPTARDARQVLTAFPFLDIAVFGDGEKTLLEICDTWQDRVAL